jgi:hypothetical protein
MKKISTSAILLILSISLVCCKKLDQSSTSTTATQSTDGYDAANNIFRIKVSSANVPYTVTIKRSNLANPNGDLQVENQSTGNPFEEPFTPAVGDSIKIVAQSSKGAVYLYALYKGVQLGSITTQTSGSSTISQFNYLVKN